MSDLPKLEPTKIRHIFKNQIFKKIKVFKTNSIMKVGLSLESNILQRKKKVLPDRESLPATFPNYWRHRLPKCDQRKS